MKIDLVAPVSKIGCEYLEGKTEVTVERPIVSMMGSQLVYGTFEVINMPEHMIREIRIGTQLLITVEVIDGTDPPTKS